MGTSDGRSKGVTPPDIMPVNASASSNEANEHLRTPISLRTARLTSSLVLASTKHAA